MVKILASGWVKRGAILALVLGVLAALAIGGLYLLAYPLIPEDPLDPGFSGNHAKELVAIELCPQDPGRHVNELTAYLDSGFYGVYLSDESQGALSVRFYVGTVRPLDQPEFIRVEPANTPSAEFMESSRTEPGCVPATDP